MARAEVQRWLVNSYPLFRRMAFFAATETDLFSLDVSLQWLLADQRWWLTNDDWFDRCKDDFSTAIAALIGLAQKGTWPIQRWRTALQVWSDPSLLPQSWHQLKDLLKTAPDNVVASIAQPLSWWLQALGKVIAEGESDFFVLIRRVLGTQLDEPFDGGHDPIFKAITLHEFRNTQLAKRFPEAALTFLDAVLAQRSFVLVDDLKVSLSEIREKEPHLESDPRFERLTRYARQLDG